MSDTMPFDMGQLPRHVAIIMDGNGRWARNHGRPRLEGHQKGADTLRLIMDCCGEWGIDFLTVYAFSTENWKRPEEETSGLMLLLEHYLEKETPELLSKNIRLRMIGDMSGLPDNTAIKLSQSISQLSTCTGPTLSLALNYGGRDEIVRAAKKVCRDVVAGEITVDDINQEVFADRLDTVGIPDPDFMIRTAGEMRLSNFLLWQLSYAEFYSTQVCWPDFGREEFTKALQVYICRTRKFGAVLE